MDRVFHHDDSMYVAVNKVYTKADGVAYSDKECKVSIDAETLGSPQIPPQFLQGNRRLHPS